MKLSICYRVHSVSHIFTFLSVTQMVLSTVPLPCVLAVTKNETLSIFRISALFSTPVAYHHTTCFTAISWLNLCTFHHSLKYSSNAVWGTHWGGSLVWSTVLGRLKPVVHSVNGGFIAISISFSTVTGPMLYTRLFLQSHLLCYVSRVQTGSLFLGRAAILTIAIIFGEKLLRPSNLSVEMCWQRHPFLTLIFTGKNLFKFIFFLNK